MSEVKQRPPPHVASTFQEITTCLKKTTGDTELVQDLVTLVKQWPSLAQPPKCVAGSWNEVRVFTEYTNGTRWNIFLLQCPTDHGFARQIQSIVTFMRSEHQEMIKNNSQFGERFLVEWALHNMPDPIKFFVHLSLEKEELTPAMWTIDMFRDHLIAWTLFFESDVAEKRARNIFLFESVPGTLPGSIKQPLTGGDFVAHVLHSAPDHRRWAFNMWKAQWHLHWQRLFEIKRAKDWQMTGM